MFKKSITLFLIIFLYKSVIACTVWGVINPENILIAKNRDFFPGNQKFISVKSEGKYKFFGLYGDNEFDSKYTVKMGINQAGLVLLMTFATTIPMDKRSAKVPYYQVMENILGNYSNIQDIYNNSTTLFKDSTPINYIFADRKNTMICELGLNNVHECKIYNREDNKSITMAQTNHYILDKMEQFNLTKVVNQQTSYQRFKQINSLLSKNLDSLNMQKFIDISFNTEATNDNPLADFDKGFKNTYQDNSIFRTFNSRPERRNVKHLISDQEVSSMIIELPKNPNATIKLYLRIINEITDLPGDKFPQVISYKEGLVNLEDAINKPESIKLIDKTCTRDLSTKICK